MTTPSAPTRLIVRRNGTARIGDLGDDLRKPSATTLAIIAVAVLLGLGLAWDYVPLAHVFSSAQLTSKVVKPAPAHAVGQVRALLDNLTGDALEVALTVGAVRSV